VIPWLQSWPLVRDLYLKQLREQERLERALKEIGYKLTPKKEG